MYVEIINKIGEKPLRIPASQVVVYADNGTPLSVTAIYGDDHQYLTAHVAEAEGVFKEALRKLGILRTVICEHVSCKAPPRGAKLLYAPR